MYFVLKPLNKPMTHGMLSKLSSVFYPLALVALVLLPGRELLQVLLDENLGCYEQVPEAIDERRRTWLSSLPLLRRLHVYRYFKQGISGEVKVRNCMGSQLPARLDTMRVLTDVVLTKVATYRANLCLVNLVWYPARSRPYHVSNLPQHESARKWLHVCSES